MKIKFLFLTLILISTSCSPLRFQKKALEKIDELIEFKTYLIKAYPKGFVDKTNLHTSVIKDKKILYYCHLFDIKSIDFISKDNFKIYNDDIFSNDGNGVLLYFNSIPFFEKYHIMWFDYSEDPLILKNDSLKKSEVAKGIFVF